MRRWRNWQTRTFEGRVGNSIRVQVPFAAPESMIPVRIDKRTGIYYIYLMTVIGFVLWYICCLLAYGLLCLIQIPLIKLDRWWISAIGVLPKILLAAWAAYSFVSVAEISPFLINCLLGVIYIVLWADAVNDIVMLILHLAKKTDRGLKVRLITGTAITLVFLTYSILNMQIVTAREHVYTTDKISRDHRFVFVADIHYGSSQTEDAVDGMIGDIRDLDPEFIVLGGDITDEFTTKDELYSLYSKLGAMDIPVYFIYGNHDRQEGSDNVGGRTYSDEDLRNAIESNGITILCDEYTVIDDEIILLGREDSSHDTRIPVDSLPKLPDNGYIINIDHSPYNYEDILNTGADLQLSGHTHAGQLFPLSIIYRFGVDNIYGEFRRGSTDLYVSSGASGWSVPLRTEAHCNYEVITVRSARNRT